MIGTRIQHISDIKFEPRNLAFSEVCFLIVNMSVTWSNYTEAGFEVAHQLYYTPSISFIIN